MKLQSIRDSSGETEAKVLVEELQNVAHFGSRCFCSPHDYHHISHHRKEK